MENNRLKFGLIGAGAIAQAYAAVLANSDLIEVAGVADTRPESAKAMAETLRCRSFTSHEELAGSVDLDAVIVCTPPSSHAEICSCFLARKVHAMCEKPFTTDLRSARETIAVAGKAGVILTMASKFRYVDDVVRTKSIVASGILGDIVLFENAFTARVDMSTRWNSNPQVSGGGVLIDNGTHSLDIMRYLLGPITEVQVIEGKRSRGLAVEETVHIFARTESGAVGSIDLSWGISKELDSYINMYGSMGTVTVGWKTSRYRQASSRDWVTFGKGYDKFQALRAQLQNFARAIRGEEPLLIRAEDALASVEVVEAAYEALRRNQWVRVGEVREVAAA